MRVACGLKLRTYLYLLSGGLEAEHDTAWSVHDIVFFCIFLNRYAPSSFYFSICCATVLILTLGLKSRVYGDPYEINDE